VQHCRRPLLIACALALWAGVAYAQSMGMGMGVPDLPILGGKPGPPAVNSFLLLIGGGNITLLGGGKLQCINC
jgi:hypothetical protein